MGLENLVRLPILIYVHLILKFQLLFPVDSQLFWKHIICLRYFRLLLISFPSFCSCFLFYFLLYIMPAAFLFYFFIEKEIFSPVKSFVWTAALNRINTNDILKRCRNLPSLFPTICIMCTSISETSAHLFVLFCSPFSLE